MKHGGKGIVYACVLSFLLLLLTNSVEAAYMELRGGNIDESGYLRLSLYATTDQNNPFNAASALLSYPKDVVRIVDIDTTESIFPLWSTEPEAEEGRVSFSGGTPAKGGFIFDGKILELVLEINEKTSGDINIDNAEILASDGLGTNIFSTAFDYSFRKEPAIPPEYDTDFDGTVTIQELSIGLVSS